MLQLTFNRSVGGLRRAPSRVQGTAARFETAEVPQAIGAAADSGRRWALEMQWGPAHVVMQATGCLAQAANPCPYSLTSLSLWPRKGRQALNPVCIARVPPRPRPACLQEGAAT